MSMFSKSAAVCPHCLREIKLGDMKFYCVPNEDNRHEVKLSFADRFKGRLPVCRRKYCRNHGLTIREAACKYCGEPLPPQILFHDKFLSFCAVGVSGAGKSSYMTTLLHELRYSGLPWVLQAMDVETTQRAQLNEQYVYEERQCLKGTQSGVSPKPQLWTILDNSKKGDKVPTYALTIYDGAGEDCERIDYTPLDAKISRYLSGAKMLLIVFDPLLLPSVRSELSRETLNASMATERQTSAPANMVSMVNSLANYIRRNCNIPPGKRIDRRAAVVLTKLDALTEMINGFASGSTILKESPHVQSRGFVQSDSEMIDLEIRDWLTRQGETAFLGAIDANFKDVRVFGVSSFGNPPNARKRLARVRPHRVLDPLMWLLASEGVIPTI
ncbi:MAG: hypothetical protein SR1Q5_09905 [Quinella sp. 1Q5]|nr:hypothetical protein [Quinella sp. 1Q5]